MSSNLSQAQQDSVKKELTDILTTLQEEVSQEMADQQSVLVEADLKGGHDLVDEAQADLESSIHISNISRHMAEIVECKQALQRLEQGEYGLCLDCAEAIELNRLKANPVSSRCLSCQTVEEANHPEVKHASM